MSVRKSRNTTTNLGHLCNISFTKDTSHRCMVGIVGTIGPTSRNVETICDLIRAGMNIARINFSHEKRENHIYSLECIRNAVKICTKELGYCCMVAIAADLKGREIRTGLLSSRKPMELKAGDTIKLTVNEGVMNRGTKEAIFVDYPGIIKNVAVGQHIFIDDNAISIEVEEVGVDCLVCRILNDGQLRGNVSVVVPGSSLELPVVSDKDADDIKFCIKNNVDILFLSKLRTAHDVREIRELLSERGRHIKLFTKLENIEALENLDDILKESDGVLFARADLSIELSVSKIFLAQKAIFARCNTVGKPVICATQLLTSMYRSIYPTRTDIVDVGNAVLDGADCLLLSSETAIGLYPVETLRTLVNTCREAEAAVWHQKLFRDLVDHNPAAYNGAHALAISAVMTSINVLAPAIFVITASGKSAQLVSTYRPRCPIFAITRCNRVARQIMVSRGIIPVLILTEQNDGDALDLDYRVNHALNVAQNMGIVDNNDAVVVLSPANNTKGFTNNVYVVYAQFDKTAEKRALVSESKVD